MRIRRNASRLLGLSYLAARPEAPPATSNELRPPPLMPAGTVYGYTAVNPRVPSVNNMEGACVLNMSPWDLPNKHDDDDCSPKEDPFEEYFVHVPRRPGFAFSSFEYFNMEMKEEDDEIKNQEPANDMKDGRENTLIIKENEPMLLEEDDKMNKTQACTVKADILTCKKNDDKRWRRSSIGDYHLRNSRSYYTPSKKARFASNILEAADKMDYMDNNMSSTSSSSYDEKSDEDYIIGGARKTHAKTRKGKKVVQKIQAKKRIKKRSLKSIL